MAMTDDMVFHYPMNDNAASTSVAEVITSEGGNAQQNTDQIDVVGKISGALSYNGTTDYIDTGKNYTDEFNASFSINFWVKATDGQKADVQYLISSEAVAASVISITIEANGSLKALYGTTNAPRLSTIADLVFDDGLNDWKMVTIVFVRTNSTQGIIDIYVDGLIYTAGTLGEYGTGGAYNTAQSLCFGARAVALQAKTLFFEGDIDSVIMFDKALSTDEILALWNNGAGSESPVVLAGSVSDFSIDMTDPWKWG